MVREEVTANSDLHVVIDLTATRDELIALSELFFNNDSKDKKVQSVHCGLGNMLNRLSMNLQNAIDDYGKERRYLRKRIKRLEDKLERLSK